MVSLAKALEELPLTASRHRAGQRRDRGRNLRRRLSPGSDTACTRLNSSHVTWPDRRRAVEVTSWRLEPARRRGTHGTAVGQSDADAEEHEPGQTDEQWPVSYTHLTLPTIYSV